MKRAIKYCAILLLLFGAAFAAYRMYDMASQYKAGKDTYGQIQLAAVQTAPPLETPEPKTTEELPPVEAVASESPAISFPTIDFDLLKERNSDTVAWVYIEGTNINYPVVQGEDNRHYVSTMFDGSVNQAGSIFMDYRNNPDMNDIHTILYGHNMQDKSMFADILNYRSPDYFKAHPVGLYITPERNYRFDIVAAYVASLADSAWQLEFVGEDDIAQWLNEAIEKTSFTGNIKIEDDDKFISLSTCSYDFEDARFVLVGILEDCGPPVPAE